MKLMARPAMKEEKKRQSLTITISPEIALLAEESSNKSRFFERSVDAVRGIYALMQDLQEGRAKRGDVLEEIEDIVDAWDALRDERVSLEDVKQQLGKGNR